MGLLIHPLRCLSKIQIVVQVTFLHPQLNLKNYKEENGIRLVLGRLRQNFLEAE